MKVKYFCAQTIYFITMCVIYYLIIPENYAYVGTYELNFSFFRMSISVGLYLLSFFCFNYVKGDFFRTTYQLMMFFAVVPSCAYLMFNNSSVSIVIIQIVPLFLLTLASRLNISKIPVIPRQIVKIDDLAFLLFFVVLTLMTVPFYLRLGSINLSNLLFSEVYQTRLAYKTSSNAYLGYVVAPLCKILFPIITVISIDRKKYFYTIISIVNVGIIYLTTGAQKDILFGLALIVICYLLAMKKGMLSCAKNIVIGMSCAVLAEIGIYTITGRLIFSTYVRRVFFTIPGLFSKYYDYFSSGAFTFYSQSRIGSLFSARFPLTTWAGTNLLGKEGLNANIGIFAEGYVSLGYLGVILASVLFVMICIYLNRLNMDSKFIGLWVAMLYLINYSLFETLMLTHGMMMFLIFSYFFIPSAKTDMAKITEQENIHIECEAKMKTALITFHESNNVGALLQAYALQTTLSRVWDLPCDILNYHCKHKAAQYSIRGKKSFLVFVNSLISSPIKSKIAIKADSFKKQYLNISEKIYNSSDEMITLNNQYEKFYCGSDQVWNAVNTGSDGAYFLDFVQDTAKIASYAPSIALSEIPENLKPFYSRNINRFKHLSIREKSGQVLIETLTGRKPEVVLDPTLLLEKNEWLQMAKSIKRKKPYIFVYYISYVPHMIDFVKKLKAETGFEVIVAIKTVRDYINGFTGKIVSPEEFIGYISEAEYVVTNSFHGTAFSINLEKEFFAFGNKKALAKANSRVTDLLELLDLSDRFVEKEYSIGSLLSESNKISYSNVTGKLAAERLNSKEYIKTTLK